MRLGQMFAVAALTIFSAGVRADIVLDQNPGNFPGDTNILFNDPSLPSTGNLIQGIANTTVFTLDFTSTTSLLANGGQARVEGETTEYQDLVISLTDPNAYFTTPIFNINAIGAGTANVTATEDNGTEWDWLNVPLSGGGQNFLRFEAINGQRMKSVKYTTTVGVEDTRQTCIGGLGTGDPGVIPEPGSMALVAIGALPLLGLRRRN